MQFLSLYTPIVSDVQPSADKLAAVGRLMQDMTKSGKLIATGGLGRRATGAFAITLKSGDYSVDETPNADWMLAAGFVILKATSRAEAVEDVKRFLCAAGDGVSEVIDLAFGVAE